MENIPNGWDLASIISLTFVKGLTYNECTRIINKYVSFDDFSKNAFNLRQGDFFENESKDKNGISVIQKSEEQIEFAEKNDYKIITVWNDAYPSLLKQIDYPPIVLYIWGDLQPADAISISVVGTRKCTYYGKMVTEQFVSEFVKQNILITSGMANGIDSIAHGTAIKNNGITYALIASGLDKISSQVANQTANDIVTSGGAVITEYKFGTPAMQGYFLHRNRIISGISKATLVVESAYKGGAMNTAKFADMHSRDVFVIPGNITSEKSLGTNNLIRRHKAIIAISPKTMLEDMGILEIDDKSVVDNQNKNTFEQNITFSNPAEEKIYNNLSNEPIHIDTLIGLTGLDISELLVQLIDMEFEELVRQLPGKHYVRNITL
ncbi:MAG: DNA-processing protein DprA [Bacteroidetes bacterium]|nr:DNA-processing protein DprA [Bacteroidota bacterium]